MGLRLQEQKEQESTMYKCYLRRDAIGSHFVGHKEQDLVRKGLTNGRPKLAATHGPKRAKTCERAEEQWSHLIPKKGPIHMSPANRFVKLPPLLWIRPWSVGKTDTVTTNQGRMGFVNQFAGEM